MLNLEERDAYDGPNRIESTKKILFSWENINFRIPIDGSKVPLDLKVHLTHGGGMEQPLNPLQKVSDAPITYEKGKYFKQILTN
jgi:hypothetical protein